MFLINVLDLGTKLNMSWPIPSTVSEVHSFLRFASYYRRSIEKLSQVAKPLYRLIMGQSANRRNKHIMWTLACEAAFNKLKYLFTSAPILAYADIKSHLNCMQMHVGLGFV